MEKYSRIKAVISLDAAAENFARMRENIHPDTKMIAVIKADGYGHGAEAIARLIEDYEYIWGFAVATAEEALKLCASGIKKLILVLGHVFEESYDELAAADVRIAVSDLEMARGYAEAGARLGKTVHIHLAVDTGMSRIGFADAKESVAEIKKIAGLSDLELEGIFTHFARADEYDKAPAFVQLERFRKFLELLSREGIEIPLHHCSNSAGILRMPEANMNLVRAGISIYGIYPSEEVEREIPLKPVMELKSHISHVKTVPAGTPVSYGGTFVTERETVIATIPVGYADGYPRGLSNKGRVLIHGTSAPILGRVCMDQFMADVTEIPHVSRGDEVTLLGRDGEACIFADELGNLSGRFPYELVCCISRRVPRVYVKDGQAAEEGFPD